LKKPKTLNQSFFEQFSKMNDAIASKNRYQNEQFFEIQEKVISCLSDKIWFYNR
jgi:hypothetical protein